MSAATRSGETFDSAEAPLRFLSEAELSEPTFTLSISDRFTFAGRLDTKGAGMAIVLDAVLAKGFWPDGFEQKESVRLYRYKREE